MNLQPLQNLSTTNHAPFALDREPGSLADILRPSQSSTGYCDRLAAMLITDGVESRDILNRIETGSIIVSQETGSLFIYQETGTLFVYCDWTKIDQVRTQFNLGRNPVYHARPFDTSIKSHFWKIFQLLAINAHEMAPSTGQWLQVRVWDAPTKGLMWCAYLCFRAKRDYLDWVWGLLCEILQVQSFNLQLSSNEVYHTA